MLGCPKSRRFFRNGSQGNFEKERFGPSLLRKPRKFFFFSLLILPFFCVPAYAQPNAINPNAINDDPIQLIKPEEGCFDFTKQVLIRCTIKKPFDPKKLAVLLNGEDLDGIDIKPDGFEYIGADLLTPGKHVLSVVVSTLDGQQLEKEFGFSVCPFRISGETNSSPEPKSFATAPDSKGEEKRVDEAKPNKKEGESTLKANSRLLNQSLLATFPGNRLNVMTSPDRNLNTLGTFNLSDSLRLKTLYMRAGEWLASPEASNPAGNLLNPSFGSSSFINQKGDMLGGVLTSELLGKQLVAEAEVNFSGFNGDTRRPYLASLAPDVLAPSPSGLDNAFSPFPFRRENTYKLRLRGEWENYNYEALYENMSFDDVLGGQGMTDTMQRYMLRVGGKFFQFNSLNLSVSQFTDIIRGGNNLSPRLTTTQAAIDYSFTKFENLPITLSYQRSMATTKGDLSGSPGTRVSMDTATANINYIKGPWNLSFQVAYSMLKENMTAANNNTNALTLTFLPVYTWGHLSIAPGFSVSRSDSHGVNTNAYTLSLDLRGDLLSPKLTYGFGVAYTRLTTSDHSAQQDVLSTNVNLFYSLQGRHWGFQDPSIGVMGIFSTTSDRMTHQNRNDYEFFLMFQTKF